jgi:hypothetical protein
MKNKTLKEVFDRLREKSPEFKRIYEENKLKNEIVKNCR